MLELQFIEEKKAVVEDSKYRLEVYKLGDYKVNVNYVDDKIVYISAKPDKDYLPLIDFDNDIDIWNVGKKEKFTIKTSSCELEANEIQQVIDGYKQVLEVVEVITKQFFK